MAKYTIQCEYLESYVMSVQVEAESVEQAAKLAIDEADRDENSGLWSRVEEPYGTFVDLIVTGHHDDVWTRDEDAKELPIPVEYGELATVYSIDTARLQRNYEKLLAFAVQVSQNEADAGTMAQAAHDIIEELHH